MVNLAPFTELSKPLHQTLQSNNVKDSVLFGDESEMNIRFILDSNDTITNYDTDVDEFEIINKSERTVTVIALKKRLAIPPNTTQVMKKVK